jgi:hypothetical protein
MITVFLLLTAPYKGLRPPTDVEKLDEIFVFLSGELYAEDQAVEAINFTNTIFAAPAPAARGLN